MLGDTLETATSDYLSSARSPSRKVNELDNRGSTFYLTLYWARALAAQDLDTDLAERFSSVAAALTEHETQILDELDRAQGSPQDVGGYYRPSESQTTAAMCPSEALNNIISGI